MTTPPTRILSWQQLVLEADPTFQRERLQPWIYQFSNGRLFQAPVQLYGTPASGLFLNGGFLMLQSLQGWPSSSAGLQPGAVFSDNLFACAVPGGTPQPGAPRLIYDGLTASQLLLAGAANIPLVSGTPGSGALFLNGGFICVA